MRRRLSLVIAFVGVLGLIGFAPTAQADHSGGAKNAGPHENSPAPPVPPTPEDGECAVVGEVIIGNNNNTGGVPLVPQSDKNHNHYRFKGVQIICEDNTNPGTGDHFDGRFQVEATGGTDGPGECDGLPGKDPKCQNTTHGEDSSAGWSHSSCYAAAPGAPGCTFGTDKMPKETWTVLYAGTKVNPSTNASGCYNCGEITVESLAEDGETKDHRKDSTSTDNYVKFCRGVYDDGTHSPVTCSNIPQGGTTASTGGSNVIAWGQLNAITDKPADQVLCFLADLEFLPEPKEKINSATLTGTASIWITTDKTTCEGKKNKP